MRSRVVRSFHVFVLLVLASSGLGCSNGGRGPKHPNVIMIVVDALRRDHVGVYGYERGTTPHLDSRAASGSVFEHCVAQAPWTDASMASMFTSLLPSETGVGAIEDSTGRRHILQQSCSPMGEEEITLAERLRDEGYRTAAVVTNPFLAPRFGLTQGFEADMRGRFSAQEVVDTGLRWIEGLQSAASDSAFFLYLHFMDVHSPNRPPGRYHRMFPPRLGPARANAGETAIERAHKRSLYDASIAFVDDEIERLCQTLEANGLMENTIVLFTSDHGEGLWDHGLGAGHGFSMYRELLDIPLILFGSGIETRRVEEPVRALDIAPTILSLIGARPPASLRGVPLAGVSRVTPDDPLEILSEDIGYGFEQKALEVDGWKVIVDHEGHPLHLFDRRRDFEELQDLLEVQPDRASALADRLHEILAGAVIKQRNALEIDEGTREQLKALGY